MLKTLIDQLLSYYFSIIDILLFGFDECFKILMRFIGYESISYAITMVISTSFTLSLFFGTAALGITLDNTYAWVVLAPIMLFLLILSYHANEVIRDLYVIDGRGEEILKTKNNKKD